MATEVSYLGLEPQSFWSNLLTKDQEPELDMRSEDSEDSDSDDDLPDINTSLQQDPPSKLLIPVFFKRQPTFKAGEVVWVKSGRNPSWPAVVNHVYHKKKRMSVLFIGYSQKKGISVNINAAKVFNSRMRDHFIEEALRTESKREIFQSIVTQVEDFLNKKACGKLDGLDAFQYFFPNETFSPDSPIGSDDDADDEESVNTHHKDTEATPSHALPHSAGTSAAKTRDPSRHNRRMGLRHKLEKRIVEYIKTKQDAQDHLAGIYHGFVPSQRHQNFYHKDRAVRDRLQGQGTGFITSDELSEELFSCLADLYLQRCEADKNFADTKYVAYVLMPEAILYGLHKVKGISLEAAQKQMDKGPERFPAERAWYKDALRAEPLTVEERKKIIHEAADKLFGREGSKQLMQLA
ncbi:MUM1L1 [Branchiostoma lanceolatum]|uniref:MUM1L1 protein n=1 Tax=Branchiostoma lanceolatum TaxID=7740 RepID=A0A8J9ZGY8_BRALA|nr:MUM1L1 [Branchiostoma lanceolatum]